MNFRGSTSPSLTCISLWVWRVPAGQKARGCAVCKEKDIVCRSRVLIIIIIFFFFSRLSCFCSQEEKEEPKEKEVHSLAPDCVSPPPFPQTRIGEEKKGKESIPIPTPAQIQGTAPAPLLCIAFFSLPTLIIILHYDLHIDLAAKLASRYHYQHSLLRLSIPDPDATTHTHTHTRNPRPIAGSSCLGCLNPTASASLPHDPPEPRVSGQRSERATACCATPRRTPFEKL